jgi:hypothetical protein
LHVAPSQQPSAQVAALQVVPPEHTLPEQVWPWVESLDYELWTFSGVDYPLRHMARAVLVFAY